MSIQYISRILFLSLFTIAHAFSQENTTSTNIGVSLVLSGPWASWGTPIRNGLELGAQQTKHNIKLSFQDDRCEAKQAVNIFQKFLSVEHLPIVILGCMECIEAALPIAEHHRATVLTMGGMSKDYLNKFPHLTGLYALVEAEAYYLIPYLRDKAKIKHLAIINHSATYGEYFGRGVESLAQTHGITVMKRESVDHSVTDFRSVVTRILNDKPEAIVVHVSAETEGFLIKQIRELGYKGQIYATFTFESPDIKSAGGESLEGVRYTSPFQSETSSVAYESFKKLYLDTYHLEPPTTSAIAYDAIKLIDVALDECAVTDNNCIANYFANLGEYNGISGKVIFGKDRSAIRPYGLKEFKHGEYVWLERELIPIS
jgi:branched-chain amino acid transport system substrate-binding protein